MHLLDVRTDDGVVRVDVETDRTLAGCRRDRARPSGPGAARRPSFGRPVRVRWFKRIWRCGEQSCPRRTWTERHDFAGPRAKLTSRAIRWAVDALWHDDTTVSALARRLGVAWDTCWYAVQATAQELVTDPQRLKGIKTIGVDEHIWRASKAPAADEAVTIVVDLTRDDHRGAAGRAAHLRHPEIARLGRSLQQWRQQILAHFTTGGVNNGGTEAINLLIEKTRRLAPGFRNFEHYRLRVLLAADGSRPYRR